MNGTHANRMRRQSSALRFNAWEVVIVLLVLAILTAAVLWMGKANAGDPTPTTTVQVRQGDSLWTIAREHPVKGLTTAEVVRLIAECNGLEQATIQAGSDLTVPGVGDSTSLAMR